MKNMTKSVLLLCVLVSTHLVACSSGPDKNKTATSPSQAQTVPASSGPSQLDAVEFKDKRLVAGFFSYQHKNALPMLTAISKLLEEQNKYNFRILAISIDYNDIAGLKKFVAEHQLKLPVLVDSADLRLVEQYKVENEVAVVGLDARHQLAFGIKDYVFADKPNGEEEFLEYLKENLGIKAHQPLEPKLGHYPEVPDFQAETSDGKTIRRSDYLGRVLHVIFFSPKCPHCQHELQFLRDQVYPEYHAKGYEVLAVNVAKMDEKTKPLYDAQHYPWPLVDDSNRKLRTQFTFNRSVPENFLVDKQGRAHFYSVGYSEQRNDLYQMQIKKLLGLATEATMNPQRMATVKACEVCHEPESVDWAVSKHARALDSLAYKSEDRNPACVSCHTLGYGDPKGYQSMTDKKTGKQMAYVPPDLAGVQCESCHGIGGPHVKGAHAVTVNEMKQKCLACHTKEWSSGFDVDKAMTQVNHSRAAEIMKMSVEEKEKMVRE